MKTLFSSCLICYLLICSSSNSFCAFDSASPGLTKIASVGNTTINRYPTNANDLGNGVDPFWSNRYTGVVGAPNGVFAYSNLNPSQTSQYFFPYAYNFAIPCNATITSVTVEVTRRNSLAGDAVDNEVRLRFGDYTYSNSNLATSALWLESTTGWETVSYTDTNWGSVLTPEMLNSELFGVVVSANNIDGSAAARLEVDAINVIVCYDLTGPAYVPIEVDVVRQADICSQGTGSFVFSPRNGSGVYEYSIDNGSSWTTNPSFTGLNTGDYTVVIRNLDGTCATEELFYSIGADPTFLQPGDAIVACKPVVGSTATLVVESIQPFHNLYNSGYQGQDVSENIQPIVTSYSVSDLCGPVFSFALDEEKNIYTGATSMYAIQSTQSPVLSVIDGISGAVTKLATLPGNHGIAGVEYAADCDQIFASNLEDGKIYRLDASNGTLFNSYDPLGVDDGMSGLAPIGERILGVTYNSLDQRLYYAVWANDRVNNANRNTIRSVQIDPNTCDFLPATDILEINLPWISEACGLSNINYSMPVGDIEFSLDGSTMLVAETGFNSAIPAASAHNSRLLEYDGSTGSWTLDTAGNSNNCKYGIGYGYGMNSRGGADFAYAGTDGTACTQGDESFVVTTGDALRGFSCYISGCYYGLQYLDASTGGDQYNSVMLDMNRDPSSQTKSVYGDIDIVLGCSQNDVHCTLTTLDPSCPGFSDGSVTVMGTGGTGNYDYSLDGTNFQSSNVFTNRSAGSYTITIRDVNMLVCTNTCSVTLVDPLIDPCQSITISRN